MDKIYKHEQNEQKRHTTPSYCIAFTMVREEALPSERTLN